MIHRFCLYGFLKNQRYFEPFLVLALLGKGLTFSQIGLLVGFRELIVNVLEIPSGALADIRGRRQAMMLSFAAYIASFVVFGWANRVWPLFLAMFFFAVGETLRTGTHKAMIFSWLRHQGRSHERTQFYGYTRSWSKIGSAVSVLVGAGLVIVSNTYTYIFFVSIVPYLLNIINLAGYPAGLDERADGGIGLLPLGRQIRAALGEVVGRRGLRRLMLEAMGFEGVFHSAKDYLQPVLQGAAVAVAAGIGMRGGLTEVRMTALLVAPVYFVLYVLSGIASRRAHWLSRAAGGEDHAARVLWAGGLLAFAAILVSGYFAVFSVLMGALVVLFVLQNFWRPILISRIDAHASPEQGATVLSIESQARRTATMVMAPLLGLAVDAVRAHGPGGAFWPVGALGFTVAAGFFLVAPRPAAPGDPALASTASKTAA